MKGSEAEYVVADGRKMVFHLDHGRGCRVVLINADGSGLTNLSGARHGCDGQPAFTADGRRIVFGRFDERSRPNASGA